VIGTILIACTYAIGMASRFMNFSMDGMPLISVSELLAKPFTIYAGRRFGI
jgi:hypothetical protein